jgi:hypothetical protein
MKGTPMKIIILLVVGAALGAGATMFLIKPSEQDLVKRWGCEKAQAQLGEICPSTPSTPAPDKQ